MKDKEITPPIMSIESLNEYDRQRWKAIEEKRVAVQKEGEKVLVKALTEQARLHKEVNEAVGIVTEMEDEYIELEKEIEAKELKALNEKNVTMADVQAGRITLGELIKEGKETDQMLGEAQSVALKELKDGQAAARLKRKEILQLELELHKQRQKVFAMRLRPAMDLIKAYEEYAKTLRIESKALYEDRMESDSMVLHKEQELLLCEGKTLGGGHKWDNLTLDDARKLVLSPIFPEYLIAELKEELRKSDVKEPITVQLHFGLGANLGVENAQLTVRPTPQPKEVVTTSDKFKKRKEPSELESVEKEVKMLTTHDLNASVGSKHIHKVEEE